MSANKGKRVRMDVRMPRSMYRLLLLEAGKKGVTPSEFMLQAIEQGLPVKEDTQCEPS